MQLDRLFVVGLRRYQALMVVVSIGAVSTLFGACTASKEIQTIGQTDLLYVVTTTGIIADITRQIAGEKVLVEGLMGPGVDPHLYEATQGDMKRLVNADLILYNGLHLEGKMAEALEKMSARIPTVAVSAKIPTELLRAPPEFNDQYDPHIWFDIDLWSLTIEQITEALINIDSGGTVGYKQRGEAYLDSLNRLNLWVNKRIKTIPEQDRVMVTAHDAFDYFGRAYGLEVHGLQGISTASEYGLNDVTRMVDLLVERKTKTVFVESSVPKRSIEALVSGCLARGHKIVIGGELFSDALGAADSPQGTYIGMVQHNVNTIVEALK